MYLSYCKRPNGHRRSGQTRMEWTLRLERDGRTVARYHCSPSTFDPQRLVEMVNRVPISRIETVENHLL
jgi:hypothetical protein